MVDAEVGAVGGLRNELNNFAIHQGTEKLPGAFGVRFFRSWGLVGMGDDLPHRAAAVGRAAENVEEHSMGDLKAGSQRFGRSGDQTRECLFVPIYKISFGRFSLGDFLSVTGRFFFELEIFNYVFRRLCDYPA